MPKAAFKVFSFIFLISIISCTNIPAASDSDKTSDPTENSDPLINLYNTWLSDCMDFGDGQRIQLSANINSDGAVSTAILTWNEIGCTGTYSMSDFEGNPLAERQHTENFTMEEISDIPDNFFVLKMENVEDSSLSYTIFYVPNKNEIHIISDFSTGHDTWADWLLEDDVVGFVADPEGYTPSTKGVIHFNAAEAPDPLANLYGTWLSDCIDFGGGNVNQIFAYITDQNIKMAMLTWTDPACTGTYSMSDIDGNPIAEPTHSQDIVSANVIGLPEGVFVPKITKLSDSSISYVVMSLNSAHDEFYELVPYSDPHDLWADWLLEDDVADFIADPVGSTPASHLKFHFSKADLP